MKLFPSFIMVTLCILLAGCQNQPVPQDSFQGAAPTSQLMTKSELEDYPYRNNERYVFLAEKDFKAWTDIIGIENRFAACEVPGDLLLEMTTDALVRTALNYPLNFLFSAYNNPLDAIKRIVKNSALYRELISREDAPEVLLRYFAKTTIDKDNTDSIFNRNETLLTYSNEMFLDYFMASGLIPGLEEGENHTTLKAIAQRKIAERRADPKTYSGFSIHPLLLLADEPSGNTRYSSTWEWWSPLNHSCLVYVQDEMTETESLMLTYQYTSDYPNASVHAMASNRYNGNGYAWIRMDPTDPSALYNYDAWLENDARYGDQITNLFYNDFYDYTTSSSDAVWIYYGETEDHTALAYEDSPVVYYLSKWGNGPLMEHTPADCPYSTTDLSYYKPITTPRAPAINGPTSVSLNTVNAYSINGAFTRVTFQWSATSISPGTPSSFTFNANLHTLCCYAVGVYQVKAEGYCGSYQVINSQKTVGCY